MATKKKPPKTLEPEPNPKAPLAGQALLKQAQSVLKVLAADLLARAKGSASVSQALRARHEKEKAAQRTADNHDTWRRNFVEQVAAAWFLSCVFVRTLEDQGLLERNRVAGPGALDSQRAFFALCPSLSERDYLLTVFRELCHFPAAADLFDPRHNPVWLLGPSADATRKLLDLFRAPAAETPAFRFGQKDTRFLGDLYQELSEDVRKRYALLQTPRFVESFILDRTLTPALERFGLGDTKLIDPTCGSGHFLLGAFDRLFDAWLNKEPAAGERSAAQKALDAVHGADINPYAVAIARFRLTLAFLDKGGYTRLKDAPKLPLHVVVADSLLHNPHGAQQELGDVKGTSVARWKGSEFQLEDEAAAREVLHQRFAAVVGNPPYITVKDGILRKRYAQMYRSCAMNYALTVPFAERFFALGRERGHVGFITANSFMKREFGKRLIEEFLANVNLEQIINTSGAFIPGHGTPTAMLFGTNETPKSASILGVLANRGEPSTPDDPEQGRVWSSIASHWNTPRFENEYISVVEIPRDSLARHPWALGGGGATDLKELLESRAPQRLKDVINDIGFSIIIGEDDVYVRDAGFCSKRGLPSIPLVVGEEVRDWAMSLNLEIVRPFDPASLEPEADEQLLRHLWPWKAILRARIVSGSTSMEAAGRKWFDVRRVSRDKHRWPLTITFAFVATHNHFVLDRGGKVFKQSAPIIKLPEGATEDDHYALLAYINSSTACFWMKQVCHNKTNASQKHTTDPARAAYEFAGTAIQDLPVPPFTEDAKLRLVDYGRRASDLASEQATFLHRHAGAPLDGTRFEVWDRIQQRLVPIQEEIDWLVYAAFGLCETTAPSPPDSAVAPGGRPFELETGHHGGFSARVGMDDTRVDTSRVPSQWLQRIPLIRGHVATLETPEFKRPWRFSDENKHPDEVRAALLRHWKHEATLDQFENSVKGATRPLPLTDVAPDEHALVPDNAVPFLAVLRYTEVGLEKYRAWEQAWDLQRREDRGETVTIGKPPEFSQGSRGKSKDYRADTTWRLRGKLDVPKERFISYPGCESDEDKEPIYGWAGWDHLERAKALAELYDHRKNTEGWPKERLQPILAGLLELLPWLLQWHNTPSEDLGGGKPGEQFSLFLEAECAEHGFTHEDLCDWRPEKKGRTKAKKRSKEAEGE